MSSRVYLRATIEEWYDREMDRLSAAYRRQNRKVLAVLALPLVLIFNALRRRPQTA